MAKQHFRLPTGGVTANRKIVRVGQQFSPSNLNIANQQPSTRNVYDFIKLSVNPEPVTLRFFSNVNTKAFPFTNISENKFSAGESLAVIRMYLAVMYKSTTGPAFAPTAIATLDESALQPLYLSQLNCFIDNNRVVKDLAISSFRGTFNSESKWGVATAAQPTAGGLYTYNTNQCVLALDDVMTIPENITFRAELLIPPIAALPTYPNTDFYLGLYYEGLGALVAPKNNF